MKKWQGITTKQLKEDSSGKWKDIKKEAIPFLSKFKTCELEYEKYRENNMFVKNKKFILKNNNFKIYLNEGEFDFILEDNMNAVLYTDESKGLKLYDRNFEMYIMVD